MHACMHDAAYAMQLAVWTQADAAGWHVPRLCQEAGEDLASVLVLLSCVCSRLCVVLYFSSLFVPSKLIRVKGRVPDGMYY